LELGKVQVPSPTPRTGKCKSFVFCLLVPGFWEGRE
jgi:hypothetical protein